MSALKLSRPFSSFVLGVLASLWLVAALPAPAGLTLTVNFLYDDADANPGDGHCDTNPILLLDQCSLRAAIGGVAIPLLTHVCPAPVPPPALSY